MKKSYAQHHSKRHDKNRGKRLETLTHDPRTTHERHDGDLQLKR